MENSPLISVLIPVYNVEKYIRRCLDSVAAQTFTNWECILVDDGSPDASGKICDEYAAKDSRFRVIHKENGGVSSARNAGLDVARGEYVTFCDSDDWVEENWLSEQLNDISTEDFDVCVCGLYGHGRARRKILNRKSSKQLIFSENGFGGFSFLRFIKRRNVGELRYDESISYLEDSDFFYRLFDKCSKILWTDKPLYHYEDNPDSVTQQLGFTKQTDTAIAFCLRKYKEEKDRRLKKSILLFYINFLVGRVLSEQKNTEKIDSAVKTIRQNFFSLFFSPSIKFKRKALIVLICFSHDFSKNFIFKLWQKKQKIKINNSRQ